MYNKYWRQLQQMKVMLIFFSDSIKTKKIFQSFAKCVIKVSKELDITNKKIPNSLLLNSGRLTKCDNFLKKLFIKINVQQICATERWFLEVPIEVNE